MIEVRGPNGVVVQFPDGTPSEQIDRAMRQATGSGAPAAPPAAPPRTMAPAPYFRPEQPQAPAAPPAQQPGITPGAFGNSQFLQTTTGNTALNPALRVAADMVRMGQPGGGAIYPGPGAAPPGGAPTPRPPGPPVNPNYVPPPPSRLAASQQPSNPNLNNPAIFTPQGQTPQGWAGPQEEALQTAAARQNMNSINVGNTPEIPMRAPPFAQWARDNPGTAATIPFAATPVGAWKLGLGLGTNLLRTGLAGAGLGGAAGGVNAATQGASPLGIAQGAGQGALFGGATGAGVPLVAQPVGRALGAVANSVFTRGAPAVSATLGEEAQTALTAARQAGLTVDSNALLSAFQNMEQTLKGSAVAVRRSTAEKAFNLLDEFRTEVAGSPVLSFDDLFNMRANLRTLYKTPDEAQRAAAASMIAKFDEEMANLPANAVLGGSPTDALRQWQSFRQIYQRAMKAEDIEVMLDVAKLAPNPDNSIVQQFRQLRTNQLRSGTWEKFWTPEERAMMEAIIGSSGGFQRAATWLSRLSSNRFLGGIAGGASLATGNPALAAGIWGAGGLAQGAARGGREQQVRGLLQGLSSQPQTISPQVQEIINAMSTAGGRMAAPDAAQSRAAKFLEGVPRQLMDALGVGGASSVRPRLVPTTSIPY